jgi:deoxyribonuclease V
VGFLIAILDVAYTSEAAGAACVLADSWTASAAVSEINKHLPCTPAKYEPGCFYKRELPLLLDVIRELEAQPAALVIDGYVWLGPKNEPGLGAHLFESLGRTTPVIGAAKSPYRHDTWSVQVLRGKSRRPLYVTAAGVDQIKAAGLVLGMNGKHRIPTLLQRADRLARAAAGDSAAAPGRGAKVTS